MTTNEGASLNVPKLIYIEVDGLLGMFNHRIKFDENWDFCILYGPNGVGKTRLLELIKAALSFDIVTLGQIPFRAATFAFNNGLELRAESPTSIADSDE